MYTLRNFILIFLVGYFFVISLFSCTSHEQKADDAFDHVKEEKMLVIDNTKTINDISIDQKKAAVVEKNNNQDEWTRYKIEMGKKILSNENKIKEIKAMPNSSAKLRRNIASLEKDNNDLKRGMEEYKEEMKVKWENFKTKMNYDVNEIGIELKDLTIKNKK